MLFGISELRFAPDRRRRTTAGTLVPREAVRWRSWTGARRGGGARTRGCPRARTIEAARGRARTASGQPREPDHHPERFIHRLGVAEYPSHIGIQRDSAVSRGCTQTLAERRVACGVHARRALGALVWIGSIEIAGRRSRCTEFAVHRRTCSWAAAGARGRISINHAIFTAIFIVETFHHIT